MLSPSLRECLRHLESDSRTLKECVALHAGLDLVAIKQIKVHLMALVGMYAASSVDDIEKHLIRTVLNSITSEVELMLERLNL